MANEIRLRQVEESDLPIFFLNQLDPEASQMAAFPARDKDAFEAHWAKILADRNNIVRTILCDGHVAGNIGSWQQSGEQLIGYWIGKEYWGRGVASKAVALFIDDLRVRPLSAHVAKHNVASLRVLEKCGFTVSGMSKVAFTGDSDVEEYILTLAAREND